MEQQQSNPPQQDLQKRSVVSSFIFKFPEGQNAKPVVALFKRSDKVNTYPHHLAPISGSISRHDTDPISAAWRELTEETSLTSQSVDLWRKGIPFTFSDPSAGREWTVHPFAFRLKHPAEGGQGENAIKIDWEHDEFQWHDSTLVVDDEAFGGVPRLQESLRRVWFESEMGPAAGTVLADGIERMRNDHESGARELAAIALGVFREMVVQLGETVGESWDVIRMAAWHLWKNGRESMGAGTLNALLAALSEIEGLLSLGPGAEVKPDRILAALDNQLAIRESTTARIKDSLVNYIRSQYPQPGKPKQTLTVLTLSASSTIKDILVDSFVALDVQTLDLRILESRPLFEGVSMASAIQSNFESRVQSSDKSLKISIYTDASAALASAGVDIVLLGADRISSTRGVSNKTGSLPAVLSARHVSPDAKVVVISETEKVKEPCVGENDVEENDPREIVNTWHNDMVKGANIGEESMSDRNVTAEVKNIYFEWVPLTLVDGFVCEEGILGKDGIKERSEQIAEKIETFFGSL